MATLSGAGNSAGAAAPAPGVRRAATLLVAVSAILLWAGTPAVTKLAVAGLDPLAVGVLRTLMAALVALPLVLLQRPALPRPGAGRAFLAVSSLGGFVVFPLLFCLGVARTSAGHASLLVAVAPLFTGLIAGAVARKLPGRRWWLGAAVALAGVALLVEGRFGLGLEAGVSLEGDLLVIAGCISAAAGYVGGARASAGPGAWAVTLWGLLVAAALLLPFALFLLPWAALAGLGWQDWAALVYLSLLSSMFAYALWYWALAQEDIGRTGAVQFAQPLLGLLIAVALLGEALTWPLLLAGLVIVAGVALAQSRR